MICRNEETTMDCFSYGTKEWFWRKNNRKLLTCNKAPPKNSMNLHLPNDILEMCLVRLPMKSLMTARLVCKKWRNLTTTRRFMQMRREGSYQTPWLFLFGAVKGGYCSGEIHAFDVSLNQWHIIDSDVLRGRFMFSLTSIQDDIYIVGGCSSLANFGRVDKGSLKTHKGGFAFSPSSKSWRKVASMKYARSSPMLAIAELDSDCLIVRNLQNHPDKQTHKSSYGKGSRKVVMIAVGGHGSWDEPLDSGEIYDPISNKWTEIQRLPRDFGVACSGVVCNGIFYVYSECDKLAGYDVEKGFWFRIATNLYPPRVHEYRPKLVSCKNRLFMVLVSWCEGDGRTGRRNKAVRKLWKLDLASFTWTEVAAHPDVPMDWNAAFVADEELIFGVEMFKIFGQVLDFVTMFDVSDVGRRWSHIGKNYVGHDLDVSSCMTKSVALLHM